MMLNIKRLVVVCVLSTATISMAHANDVTILSADFKRSADQLWTVRVTLKHGDTGWDHYADNWRIVDSEGNILGDRVLYHPHVNEQPFTRSLARVQIPESLNTVYIEAHDKLHGWAKQRLTINMDKVRGGKPLTIRTE